MAGRAPTEEEVLGYFKSCSNWGRWGAEDELGTVNYITPMQRKRAASLVEEGVSVTCARPMRPDRGPDVGAPMLHFMTSSGEAHAGKPTQPGTLQASGDFFGISYHGYTTTHVDSLCHVFWDGKMYNGFSADEVTSREGAKKESIELLANGVVTRGVLLDIAQLRGVKWLEPGDAIFPEELEAAEKACGVRVESGDVLLVRTGWYRMRLDEGPQDPGRRPGLHAACVPWVHEREVAMLGGDGTNDPMPSEYKGLWMAFHQIGIVGMGLWLMDNANLEELSTACERYKRWEFQLNIGPLRIVNGTGSPVNPIAVF